MMYMLHPKSHPYNGDSDNHSQYWSYVQRDEDTAMLSLMYLALIINIEKKLLKVEKFKKRWAISTSVTILQFNNLHHASPLVV